MSKKEENGITSITQTLITQFYNEKEQYMIDNLLNDIQENKDKYKGLTIIPIKREQVVELLNKGKEYDNLNQQLAEKDKEIEELKESNGVTKELYKNYYTQLQNYKSKLYDIDIPKLRKKHLTPEEEEIYYKGFEDSERQIASHIADITIECRHQICEKIREIVDNQDAFDTKMHLVLNIVMALDEIERGE